MHFSTDSTKVTIKMRLEGESQNTNCALYSGQTGVFVFSTFIEREHTKVYH